MNDKNINEIGEQFKEAVTDALATGDFNQLNGLVKETVDSALKEARNQANMESEHWREDMQRTRSKFSQDTHRASNMTNEYVYNRRNEQQNPTRNRGYESYQQRTQQSSGPQQRGRYDFRRMPGEEPVRTASQTGQGGQGGQGGRAGQGGQGGQGGGMPGAPGSAQRVAPKRYQTPVFRKSGGVSGTLLQVFGGIGIGTLGIAALVMAILFLAIHNITFLILFLSFLLMMIGCGFMISGGTGLKSRLQRATTYFELFGKNKYLNLSELELHTGKSRKYLLKDIKKMMKQGIFPQAHLDLKEECLILDDATYQQYLNLEKQRVQLQLNESQKKDLLDNTPGMTEAQKQLNAMIAEGQEYIRQLREMNDQIPGEVISEKLYHLEDLLKEIFSRLSEHPEQMPKMHKVMSYYLPTTMKLVSAYAEFDKVSEQGQDIVLAKAEIENTLDTINDSFVELLNNLFRDAAFDAATDAQVLKSMLAREGLTKEPDFAPLGADSSVEQNKIQLTFDGIDEN